MNAIIKRINGSVFNNCLKPTARTSNETAGLPRTKSGINIKTNKKYQN